MPPTYWYNAAILTSQCWACINYNTGAAASLREHPRCSWWQEEDSGFLIRHPEAKGCTPPEHCFKKFKAKVWLSIHNVFHSWCHYIVFQRNSLFITSLSSFFVQMCIFSHLLVTIQINIPWIMLFSVTAYRVGLTEIKCFKCQGKNNCMVDAVLVWCNFFFYLLQSIN